MPEYMKTEEYRFLISVQNLYSKLDSVALEYSEDNCYPDGTVMTKLRKASRLYTIKGERKDSILHRLLDDCTTYNNTCFLMDMHKVFDFKTNAFIMYTTCNDLVVYGVANEQSFIIPSIDEYTDEYLFQMSTVEVEDIERIKLLYSIARHIGMFDFALDLSSYKRFTELLNEIQ